MLIERFVSFAAVPSSHDTHLQGKTVFTLEFDFDDGLSSSQKSPIHHHHHNHIYINNNSNNYIIIITNTSIQQTLLSE